MKLVRLAKNSIAVERFAGLAPKRSEFELVAK
jgi:hypothetical protein